MLMNIPCVKETDLLFGFVSTVPRDPSKHFLLCDIDKYHDETEKIFYERVMKKIQDILFEEFSFDTIYLIKSSDTGVHIVSFDYELSLNEYVTLLEKLECDDKYIEWVRKVKYGVLRLSRRSKHFQVPSLVGVFRRKGSRMKRQHLAEYYFSMLRMENNIFKIKRVKVTEYDTKNRSNS